MRTFSVKMRNIREKKSELKEKSKILRKFIKKRQNKASVYMVFGTKYFATFASFILAKKWKIS